MYGVHLNFLRCQEVPPRIFSRHLLRQLFFKNFMSYLRTIVHILQCVPNSVTILWFNKKESYLRSLMR